VIVLVVTLSLGASGRIWAIIVATLASGAFAAISLARDQQVSASWRPDFGKSALAFALPMVPHSLSSIALSQGDRFIIADRLGLAEAGIYAVAMQLALPIWLGAEAVNRAYAPWLFRTLAVGARDVAIAATIFGAVAITVGSAFYAASFGLVLTWVVGERYEGAREVILWLMPGMAAQAIYFLAINFIFFSERTRMIPVITVTSAAFYLLVGFYMAGEYGARGLAITFSVVQLTQTAAIFMLASRVAALPWTDASIYRGGMLQLGASVRKLRRP
jgi:O-antigen/teichoic acid export membrane protein